MLTLFNNHGLNRTLAMMEDVQRQFDKFLTNDFFTNFDVPAFRMKTLDNAFELTAELPGMTESNLEISLEDGVLTLSGERDVEVPEGYTVHRKERPTVNFEKRFTLPTKVDPDKTVAKLEEGVLTLTLEKAAEAQPKKIQINEA